MTPLITAIIQLLVLVFKSWADRDAERRKANEESRIGWKDAAKSGDISRINAAIDKLRK